MVGDTVAVALVVIVTGEPDVQGYPLLHEVSGCLYDCHYFRPLSGAETTYIVVFLRGI